MGNKPIDSTLWKAKWSSFACVHAAIARHKSRHCLDLQPLTINFSKMEQCDLFCQKLSMLQNAVSLSDIMFHGTLGKCNVS